MSEQPSGQPENVPQAEELAADLERMGATFVKVGQLLSTRADLLNRLGKKDEAISTLESAKGRLTPGSKMAGSLESKLKQARLPGSPLWDRRAPILGSNG